MEDQLFQLEQEYRELQREREPDLQARRLAQMEDMFRAQLRADADARPRHQLRPRRQARPPGGQAPSPAPARQRRQPAPDADLRIVAQEAARAASRAVSRRLRRSAALLTPAQRAWAARRAGEAASEYILGIRADEDEEMDEDEDDE